MKNSENKQVIKRNEVKNKMCNKSTMHILKETTWISDINKTENLNRLSKYKAKVWRVREKKLFSLNKKSK